MFEAVRSVIFDVDGVLLDARPSYHAVAEEAARQALARLIGDEAARRVPFEREREVAQFKAAGGFNDDWEMARAIALVLLRRSRGAAPDLAEMLRHTGGGGVEALYGRYGPADFPAAQLAWSCGALYGGKSHCKRLFGFEPPEGAPERGYWEREQLLVAPALLAEVAARFPLALFTGRNPGEAELALLRTNLEVAAPLRWVADGRPRKPDPHGLVELCKELPAAALFVGDTADDQSAATAAQARGAPLLYAHVVEPGDTARVLEQLLREARK